MNRIWHFAAIVIHPSLASSALAAEGLDGKTLSFAWALPFIGLLATIALGPLVFARFWHHHYGKIAAAWAALALLPILAARGFGVAAETLLHAILVEYIPFIVLLFTLYTVAGGILITGQIRGAPAVNTAILALGTVLASIVGTTGASMILIRPLIRANERRRHRVHVVIFFIFLVSNIGGSLTPLGDPPLFVGFLRGVDFFWTTRALLPATAFAAGLLLTAFYLLDGALLKREGAPPTEDDAAGEALGLQGGFNLVLLAGVIVTILACHHWDPGFIIPVPGAPMPVDNLVRDTGLLALAGLSLWLTPGTVRAGNAFSWEPIAEVAKLFAAIFVAVAPVIAMLQAGKEGAFAPLVRLVTSPAGEPLPQPFFWLTGLLSAFLDNAPTYLVFFELAGGNAVELMGAKAATLTAISLGAVFMGALTYIGNAPNLMVAAIARDMRIEMPGFGGYMLWSFGVLGPVFGLMAVLFVK